MSDSIISPLPDGEDNSGDDNPESNPEHGNGNANAKPPTRAHTRKRQRPLPGDGWQHFEALCWTSSMFADAMHTIYSHHFLAEADRIKGDKDPIEPPTIADAIDCACADMVPDRYLQQIRGVLVSAIAGVDLALRRHEAWAAREAKDKVAEALAVAMLNASRRLEEG